MPDQATKWIEDALRNKKVNSISSDELKDLESLDKGGFGSIVKATWTKINDYVVYKRLIKTAAIDEKHMLDAFVRELKIHLHLDSDHSDRIIRCFGISQGNLNYLSIRYILYFISYLKTLVII